MQNPYPRVTKGRWGHVACKAADTLRNLPCFKAVAKVLAEGGEESKPCNEGNQLCPFCTGSQRRIFSKKSIMVRVRSKPSPVRAAASAPRQETGSLYLQGNGTSSASDGVNISVQLKGEPCSGSHPASTPLHTLLFWLRIKRCTLRKPKLLSRGEISLKPAATAASSTR